MEILPPGKELVYNLLNVSLIHIEEQNTEF